jgi:ribosomal-protein-alanine N-acetyltransferase
VHSLRTARLGLEPQRAIHAGEMFRVLRDPAIYRYENQPPPSELWLRDRYARLEGRRSPDGRERWLNWVMRLEPHGLIGYVQATTHPGRRAAIGYEMASAWWGQGLASEAVAAMLGELAASYGVDEVYAIHKAANSRSARLLERLGFEAAAPKVVAAAAIGLDERLVVRRLDAARRRRPGVDTAAL